MSYLGIRGIGTNRVETEKYVERTFNSMPILAYWDIYKNYYANKQEGKGMFINNVSEKNPTISEWLTFEYSSEPNAARYVRALIPWVYEPYQLVPSAMNLIS